MTLSSIRQKSYKLVWLIRRTCVALVQGRSQGELLFDWEHVPAKRTDLILAIIAAYPCASYLEIGCQGDKNFRAIKAAHKVGVDPASGGTHRMTSDAFFAQNKEQFDCIFIDGLHTYEQARKDVINSLNCLNPRGILIMHDMLPASWEREHVPRLYPIWNGTVWKIAYELLERFGRKFGIVMADHGVGVVFNDAGLFAEFSDSEFETISARTFDDFKRDNSTFDLVPLEKFNDFVASRAFSVG